MLNVKEGRLYKTNRRALILLYREGAITREEFIDFWKVVYGKDK